MGSTAIPRVLGVVSAILLLAAAAGAQSVHEVIPGGDSITGSIADGTEVDRIPIRLVEGASFSATLKAAKGSALLPTLALLGPDRQPDATLATYTKASAKGNSLSVKNLPVTETGLRWLEIRGKAPTTGGWILTTKIKLPKGVTGAPAITAAQGVTNFEFPAPGNALATVTVKAAKGSLANPAFGSLRDPLGANVLVDGATPGKTGFVIKNVNLAKPGRYVLVLQPGTGGDGPLAVSIKWKVPKPLKRALLESQVITDPVVTSIDPVSGNNSQVLNMTVVVDFAKAGAKVRFSKPPTVVTAPAISTVVGASDITFTISLASFQKGDYDVEVENLDGGKGVIAKAFNVVNAPATLNTVTPAFGYDNESAVEVNVTGSFINGGAGISLVMGGDVIPGTSVLAVSNNITATFDLRNHGIGFFDVVVSNPDAAPSSLAGAFEIRNSPPLVTALAPNHNLDGALVNCTIDGSDFDATPTVLLRKAGQPDIAGTSVVRVSGTQLTCTFDTTGRPLGTWDLRVTNPDLNFATLPGAFRISGAVAPVAKVLSPANTADGPPALVWNGTRNEFLVGWVDENAGVFDTWIQRLDATGSPVGVKVPVSSNAGSVLKRDLALAWNATNDEYLALWCEPRATPSTVNTNTKHPSYYSYANGSLLQVFSQRFKGSDLAAQGTNTQVTNHTALASSTSYYMDEFNNNRPVACWDPKNGRWQILWMQEWSTNAASGYGNDDWDVLQQTLDPATDTLLGNPISVATSPYHEGDPFVVWDPVNQTTIAAWNFRNPSTNPMSGVIAGSTVTTDSIDTQDFRLVVDPDAGRLLATWTKSPTSGPKYVEGVTLNLSSPGTKVGSIVTVGSGSDDHFFASPVYNPSLKEALIAWTRKEGSGALTVRSRRATTGTASGLVLIGSEQVTSSGSSDEAIAATAYSGTAGESVVLWLKTMNFVNVNTYAGSCLQGIYRGKEFWFGRYR